MLNFIYGTMGCGKSLQLLAKAYNFQDRNIPFIIFKSKTDTRNGENAVYSRAMEGRECITVSDDDNLFDLIATFNENYLGLTPLKWVLVDECQFLQPEQIDQLAAISDVLGINVLCYGLRTDFQTHLFPASRRLFEIADNIEEIKSSCYCDKKTIFNARVNGDRELVTEGDQIEVGGDDRYITLCRKCFNEKIGNKLYQNNNLL